jgi:hypothetical protein
VKGRHHTLQRESVDLFTYGVARRERQGLRTLSLVPGLAPHGPVPHIVQLIKLVQSELGGGNPRVRPPRLELAGGEAPRGKEGGRTRHADQAQAVHAWVDSESQDSQPGFGLGNVTMR